MTETVVRTPSAASREQRALLLVALLLILAVAGFALTWLLVRGGGKPTTLPVRGAGPAAVSEAQLQLLARSVRHPVYWAGRQNGTYELTWTSDGRIYVRYLPRAANVGDRSPKYLTVGTYPSRTAFRNLQRAAKRAGSISLGIDHGGLLVINRSTPKSVYIAYPGSAYEVEVFDPSPQRARALVLAGQITSIK
jgi:hypothetical protein